MGRPKGIRTLYGKRARALNKCYWCAEPSDSFYCPKHKALRNINDNKRKELLSRQKAAYTNIFLSSILFKSR